MSRLPVPGSDDGTWGNVLNDFLGVEHNSDGTLKSSGSLTNKISKAGDTMTGTLNVPGGAVVPSDWFNVKVYGAVGNGTTDDTAAIQTAINAMPSAGGIVYLPTGTYRITSALTIKSDIFLRGAGANATILKQTSTTAHGVYALTARRMSFEDLQILGPGSGVGSGTGIYLDTSGSAVAQCQFNNVFVQQFGVDGIYLNTPIATVLSNVRSQNHGRHGFNFFNGTSIQLNACYAAGVSAAGFYLDTMTYCALNGCASDSNGTGYWAHSGGNIVFVGCGCEVPTNNSVTYAGYSYVAHGGTQMAFYDCYSTGNPSIAYWFTNGTTLGLMQNSREVSPTGTATASIKVDSGCTATVMNASTVTVVNYANGTTNLFERNGIQTFGPGTTSMRVSRGANTNFGSIVLSTAAVDQWGVQMINNSTDDLHFKDVLNGHDLLVGEQHAAQPNVQLLSDTKSFGGGIGVIGIGNANTIPTTNPTGGVIFYAESGVLKWRDPSGNIYSLNVAGSGGAITATSVTATTNDLNLVSNGANKVIVKPGTDNTNAFEVTNAAASSVVLDVDTTNKRVGVNNTAPGVDLDVGSSSASTTNIRLTRGSTSNFGGYTLATGSSDQWSIQLRNDSTNDLHVRDNINGRTPLKFSLTNGVVTLGLGIAYGRTTVADANYTVLTTDRKICYTSISAARVVTLPSVSTASGQSFVIKDESGSCSVSNTITITPASGTIDGAANRVINTAYGVQRVYSNGTNWFTE
jgi:hypothetical protein